MKTIYFVTTNEGKYKNAKAALRPYGIDVKQLKIELIVTKHRRRPDDTSGIAASRGSP